MIEITTTAIEHGLQVCERFMLVTRAPYKGSDVSAFCNFDVQLSRRGLNPSPLQWPLAVLGVVLYAATLHGQLVPHPYISLERGERIVDLMIHDGSVRRASAVLRSLEQAEVRAATDVTQIRVADVYRYSNQRELADRTLQRFETARPNSPEIPFVEAERGFAALEDEQWPSASEHLSVAAEKAIQNQLSRSAPEYKDLAHLTLFWLGVSQAQRGLFAESIDAFRRCAQVDSTGPYAARAIFAVGQLYERNGSPDEAAAAYARIRSQHPRGSVVVAARIREAQMYLRKRSPERATDVLVGIETQIAAAERGDTAIVQPQILAEHAREELHVLRVSVLLQRNKYAEGLDTAQAFLRLYESSPYTPLVRLNAGYAALYLDSARLAVDEFERVLSAVSDDASPVRQQALLYRAVALRRVGREAEAGAAFADLSARSDYPYQAQTLVELGQGAYQRGDMDGARKVLERAERASSDPTTIIRARLLLGAVYIEKQQWANAAEAYGRAEQLASTASEQFLKYRDRYLAEARLKHGICLLQENEREAAIRVLTEYLGNHPNDPQRDEGTFWLAEAMYRNDLLRNAQGLYEEIVNRFTASIRREEALYGLAWTHFRKREFDKSVKVFNQLLEAYPNSRYATDALVRKGDGMYITRRYAEAAKQYLDAARRSPNSEEGLYAGFQAGQALYRAGSLAEASKQLRAYASAHSNSKLADDALYLNGWIAFQQHDDAAAITEFQRLLEAYPNGDQAVRALYTMADAKYNLGDVQGAIDTYKQVVDRFPRHPLAVDAGKSMQMALIGEGRTEEAVAIADSWINADPTGPVAQEFAWEKANIFYTGRNYKSASDELQAYMAKFPQSDRADDALYLLGKSNLTMNQLPQALDAFGDLQRRFPTSPFVVSSKLDLADYHRDQARAQTADSLYAIVQKDFPNDTASASRAGYERATIARQQLDTTRAIQQFRLTADHYPGTEYGDQARYQLALYYRGQRQPDSARAELAVLVRTSPDALIRANALYDMGDMYARERRWPEAAEVLERVRVEYPGHEDWYTLSLLGLGACYEQMDEPEKAKEAYGVVAQLRPDDDYGKTALARLKRLEKKK